MYIIPLLHLYGAAEPKSCNGAAAAQRTIPTWPCQLFPCNNNALLNIAVGEAVHDTRQSLLVQQWRRMSGKGRKSEQEMQAEVSAGLVTAGRAL